MATVKRRSTVPYYVAAGTWVIYALLFPLYRVPHFLFVAVVSGVVFFIMNAVCGTVEVTVPDPPKKEETTGNPELDKMIKDGNLAISEMKRLNDSIKDAKISADIDRLEERFLAHPALAIEQSRLTINAMAEEAKRNFVEAVALLHGYSNEQFKLVEDLENSVDRYEDKLGTYLVKLSSRELNHADSQSVNTLLHTISDFERISDHSVNLLESAEEMHQKEIHFSKDAQEELQVLEGAVQDVLSRTTDAFRKGDLHLAGKVEPLETVVDELVRAIKARHVARLQTGSCSIEYGFVLEDLLTNYERVCDHCSNVAVAQIEVAQDSFDTHAYLNDLRYGNETKESEQFQRRLDRYRERYLFPDSDTAPADAKEEPNK